MHIRAECRHPVGEADKKQRFLRAERLAMDGKAGGWRNHQRRARDGMHIRAECRHPVGAADKKHSFLRGEAKRS